MRAAVMTLSAGTLTGMDKNQPSLVETVNEFDFEAAVLRHDGPVLVDFSTSWCGPCRALTPIVQELAREEQGKLKVVAVDGDESVGLTSRLGIRGFPTVVLFRDGAEVARRLGLTTKKRLKEMIAESAPRWA